MGNPIVIYAQLTMHRIAAWTAVHEITWDSPLSIVNNKGIPCYSCTAVHDKTSYSHLQSIVNNKGSHVIYDVPLSYSTPVHK